MTLKLLPSPRATGATAIPSAELLALPARRGDHRAEVARLTLVIADHDETIANLRVQLDAALEERDAALATGQALFERVTELEGAARTRPSRLAALWAAACLGWWHFWNLFETDASREGLGA